MSIQLLLQNLLLRVAEVGVEEEAADVEVGVEQKRFLD